MTKRRGKGEGSIYQRKDGLWCAFVAVGYDDKGRRKRRYVYGSTKAEVQEKLVKLQTDAASGLLVMAERLTVAEFLNRWLKDSVQPRVRSSTFGHYENLIRTHINPHLGGTQLSKLQPIQVQSLFPAMEQKGSSARMRQHAYGVLHNAVGQALRWGLVPRNVVEAVDKPRAPKPELQVLDREQAQKLLEAAKKDRFHALYVLALVTGMRQGELFGLYWEDVNFQEKYLSVRRTLLEVKTKPILGEPKTAKGRRRIDLPSGALLALKDHRTRMFAEGHRKSPFVFCDTQGGALRKSNFIRSSFAPLLKKADLPRIRFHDLRHTAATLLLSEGVHPKIVQERLGHAQISVTLDTYSHVLPTLQREAAEKLERLLGAT